MADSSNSKESNVNVVEILEEDDEFEVRGEGGEGTGSDSFELGIWKC